MNNQEMIDKATELHAVHAFDSAKIVEIVEAGIIPEGTIIHTRADQVVKYEHGSMVVYTNGKVTKELPATEGQYYEQALIMYAYGQSKINNRGE